MREDTPTGLDQVLRPPLDPGEVAVMSQGSTKMARGEGRLRGTALHPLCRSVSAKMLADAALHAEFSEHAHGQPWAEIHAQVVPSSKSRRRRERLPPSRVLVRTPRLRG